jgi:hypothetical protein
VKYQLLYISGILRAQWSAVKVEVECGQARFNVILEDAGVLAGRLPPLWMGLLLVWYFFFAGKR